MKKVDARAALRDRARVVSWGVAIWSAILVAGAYLAQNHTGAVLAQIVIAEFGTGRLGVAWSDPLAPLPTASAIARRAGRGALFGAAAAVMLVGASIAVRSAALEIGSFSVVSLVAGFVTSACVAATDELIAHGLVLRALGPTTTFATRIASGAAASAALHFGTRPNATWISVAFALFGGAATTSLWLRDRGAWIAISASAAFLYVTGPLSKGAVLDVRAPVDLDATLVGLACAAVFAASAIVWARGKDSGSIAP